MVLLVQGATGLSALEVAGIWSAIVLGMVHFAWQVASTVARRRERSSAQLTARVQWDDRPEPVFDHQVLVRNS